MITSLFYFEENYAFYGPQSNAVDFSDTNSASECCDLCRKDGANCASFSYLTDNKMCLIYSKDQFSNYSQRPNTIGGTPN